MATTPNFAYADRIAKYLEEPENFLLEELKGYRELHPRKFLAALAWGWGRKSKTYKQIEKATRKQKDEVEEAKRKNDLECAYALSQIVRERGARAFLGHGRRK